MKCFFSFFSFHPQKPLTEFLSRCVPGFSVQAEGGQGEGKVPYLEGRLFGRLSECIFFFLKKKSSQKMCGEIEILNLKSPPPTWSVYQSRAQLHLRAGACRVTRE